MFPFPQPTNTIHQRASIPITPNASGNFLVELVMPMLLDQSLIVTTGVAPNLTYVSGNLGTVSGPAIYNGNIFGLQNGTAAAATGSVSNLYVNTNNNLSGTTYGVTSDFTPITMTQTIVGAFNSYIPLCAKISVRYIGRIDAASGFFGSSYHLTNTSAKQPDTNSSNFTYLEQCQNATFADLAEGINSIYFPADTSYLDFMRVNVDGITDGSLSSNIRLNIWGQGMLPTPIAAAGSVSLTVTLVWNVIPSPTFADYFPLDYNIQEETVALMPIAQQVPAYRLASHKNTDLNKIGQMLELPQSIVKGAALRLKNSKDPTKTILDFIDFGSLHSDKILFPKELIMNLLRGQYNRPKEIKELSSEIGMARVV